MGEFYIRGVVAHEHICHDGIWWFIIKKEAAQKVVHEKLTQLGGTGGIIAIDKKGNIVMEFNTEGMYRGDYKNDSLRISIYKIKIYFFYTSLVTFELITRKIFYIKNHLCYIKFIYSECIIFITAQNIGTDSNYEYYRLPIQKVDTKKFHFAIEIGICKRLRSRYGFLLMKHKMLMTS